MVWRSGKYAAAGAVLAVVAALAEIGSFVMDNGGFITRTAIWIVGEAQESFASAMKSRAQGHVVSAKDRCRKTAVIPLDAECGRGDACRGNPPPRVEICVQTR